MGNRIELCLKRSLRLAALCDSWPSDMYGLACIVFLKILHELPIFKNLEISHKKGVSTFS